MVQAAGGDAEEALRGAVRKAAGNGIIGAMRTTASMLCSSLEIAMKAGAVTVGLAATLFWMSQNNVWQVPGISPNWGGYVARTDPAKQKEEITSASAAFTVPSVKGGDFSQWVGISSTLGTGEIVQAGVVAFAFNKGVVYLAFAEDFPHRIEPLGAVMPGDEISVNIALKENKWNVTLSDTNGRGPGNASFKASFEKDSQLRYAEWIVEPQTICTGGPQTCVIEKLGDFGVARFSSAGFRIDGTAGKIDHASMRPMVLAEPVIAGDGSLSVLMGLSSLIRNGDGFAVTYSKTTLFEPERQKA